MYFRSPLGTVVSERVSDAFVDDTQNGTNDAFLAKPWPLEKVIRNLESIARAWDKLLQCLGGALEPRKCFYYIIYWHWVGGLQELMKIDQMLEYPTITLMGQSHSSVPISQKEVTTAHKTLGIYMTPSGSELAQAQYLSDKADSFASKVLQSRLSKAEVLMAYQAFWLPSITYSLGITTLSGHQLLQIQSLSTAHFLQKLGFNKHVPRAVAYGPKEYGGLSLR
jgi:hypothetical protein